MVAPDHELLDRAVAGDGEALGQLLEQSGPRVRRTLAGKIPHRWQSVLSLDDVMQEAYIDAFLDIHKFEPRGEGSFDAWLFTVANRTLLDAVRLLDAEKRGRKHRMVRLQTRQDSLDALCAQISGKITSPSHRLAGQEAKAHLTRTIEHLPDTYRTVVELYDLKGLDAAQVADVVQRSPGAVFMLRGRAHRLLSDMMGAASQFLSGGR